MERYFSNRKATKDLRKVLRKRSTSAEATLWGYIKNQQLSGRKFRRQHGLGNYIVDFYCPSEKLIVELDGDPHGEYFQIEKDTVRDKYLESLGYKIIRFENKFVFQDPGFVLDQIKKRFID